MSNLHAAIGVAQAERLDDLIRAKRRIRDRYAGALAGLPGITFQDAAPWAEPTWWFTTISLGPQTGTSSGEARKRLASLGIQAGPPWTALHLTGAHRSCAPGPCPAAEHLSRTAIHLPCSATLSTADQDKVITAIRDIAGTGTLASHVPMALARSAGRVNMLVMIPRAAGFSMAPPAAWSTRKASSHGRLGARLHSQEPSVNRDRPVWNTAFLPSRSASAPASMSRLASTTVYAATTH
jgi:hypothetical protein